MRSVALLTGVVLLAAACGGDEHAVEEVAAAPAAGPTVSVLDTLITDYVEASGVARPYGESTLSTKLMGTVTEVGVREGDVVRAGQPLLTLDAQELTARRAQVQASINEAEAMLAEAETHARRMRALFADDAAPQAQLDQAETGLSRARAAVAAARAGAAEVDAMARYAVLRAPFAGTVTRRFVDPGAFAAPGAPLLTVQDGSRLRVAATTSPDMARGLSRGDTVRATIEDVAVVAVVEGVVPAGSGNLYTVNALVENPGGRFLPGSAATLALGRAQRRALLVPASAVIRRGDLTGVRVRTDAGTEVRWIRVGREVDGRVEVLTGLRAGDDVVADPALPVQGA